MSRRLQGISAMPRKLVQSGFGRRCYAAPRRNSFMARPERLSVTSPQGVDMSHKTLIRAMLRVFAIVPCWTAAAATAALILITPATAYEGNARTLLDTIRDRSPQVHQISCDPRKYKPCLRACDRFLREGREGLDKFNSCVLS